MKEFLPTPESTAIDQMQSLIYYKLINQNIRNEKAMETTRNLSVFIVAGMMFFIFGFPQTSSHLIAIIGSLTIFVLQIFECRELSNNHITEKRIKLIEEYLSKNELDEIHQSGFMTSYSSIKPEGFIYYFAATIYKNYILIFLTLDICWFSKLYLFPYPAASWTEFLNRPQFGFVPGWFFYAFAAAFWVVYFSLAIWYKIKSTGSADNI